MAVMVMTVKDDDMGDGGGDDADEGDGSGDDDGK